jgi:ribosome modulation factor
MATRAYVEGYNAYKYGQRLSTNPYRLGTYSRTEWFTGWQAARQGKSRYEGLKE